MRLRLDQHRRWPCPSPTFTSDPLLTPDGVRSDFTSLSASVGAFPVTAPAPLGAVCCLHRHVICSVVLTPAQRERSSQVTLGHPDSVHIHRLTKPSLNPPQTALALCSSLRFACCPPFPACRLHEAAPLQISSPAVASGRRRSGKGHQKEGGDQEGYRHSSGSQGWESSMGAAWLCVRARTGDPSEPDCRPWWPGDLGL